MFCCLSGWLDDIGLPQYKDQFLEARIDGRMLHLLTVVCSLMDGNNPSAHGG